MFHFPANARGMKDAEAVANTFSFRDVSTGKERVASHAVHMFALSPEARDSAAIPSFPSPLQPQPHRIGSLCSF